jgi:hypothetical protein
MRPSDSTVAVSVRTDRHSAVVIAPDGDFEARWTAWRARGLAAAAISCTFLRP